MKNILLIISILSLAVSCTGKTQSQNKADIQSTTEGSNIIRFDTDLYNYILNPTTEGQNSLTIKYPQLLPALGQTAINMPLKNNEKEFFASIVDYFDHPMLLAIYKDAIDRFSDTELYDAQKADIEQIANGQLSGKKLPQLAFHVSGFKENAIVLENLISISTDKYMGTDYNSYQDFFSGYQLQQMQPKMVMRDYLRAWVSSDKLINEEMDKDLLAAMIAEGKILYALSVLLPRYSDRDIIGYTDEQMEWARQNEKSTWETMIKNSHLFSKELTLIVRYTDETAFADKTKVKLARWIGWQIVDKYAKNTKGSLSEILNTDARTILKNSKYNP